MKFLTGIVLGSLSLVVLSSRAERISRGQLQLENIPEIPPEVSARCDQYENVRSANLLSWHPQGDGILIRTRFAETAQVHLVARPGGARWQLTFFQEPVGSASYSPDPRLGGFALTRDVGGAEFDQIYWMDTESGRSSLLSDGSSVNRAVTWSNRGDCFAYVSTRRNGRDFDLYVASMPDGGTSRLVLEREGLWVPGDWSPDDSRVMILQYVSVAESGHQSIPE